MRFLFYILLASIPGMLYPDWWVATYGVLMFVSSLLILLECKWGMNLQNHP